MDPHLVLEGLNHGAPWLRLQVAVLQLLCQRLHVQLGLQQCTVSDSLHLSRAACGSRAIQQRVWRPKAVQAIVHTQKVSHTGWHSVCSQAHTVLGPQGAIVSKQAHTCWMVRLMICMVALSATVSPMPMLKPWCSSQ